MIDRILLALDDSPASEVALAFTRAYAARSSASVHVFHVNERLVGGRGLTLHTRDEAAALLTGAVADLRAGGIRADGSACVAACHEVPRRIVEAALNRGADVIVLGSHRRRGLGRLFSSRVRERTTRLTSLLVLVAPSPLKVTAMDGAGALSNQVDQALASLRP